MLVNLIIRFNVVRIFSFGCWLVISLCRFNEAYAQEYGDLGPPGDLKTSISFKNITSLSHDPDLTNTSTQEFGFSAPVYQEEKASYSISAKNQKISFVNPKNAAKFDAVDSLNKVQYGLSYTMEDSEKSIWGFSTTYGSASDRPFEDQSVSAVDITLSKKVTVAEGRSWIYFLNYSNNRSLLNGLPLPGIAYLFTEPDKKSGGMIGIPFVFLWSRPSDALFLSLQTILPTNLSLQAGYMVWGPLQGNFKIEWNQQTFFRYGRLEKNEQIYFEKKRAVASLKAFFGRGKFVELELANVFDQSLFNGKSMFDRTSDKAPLSNEIQGVISAQYSF